MGKRVIMYLMAAGVIGLMYYKESKRNKEVGSMSILHGASVRVLHGTDPISLSDSRSMQLCSRIYEGLYTYQPFKRDLNIVPNLAEEMPSISPDKLVYTFKIRQGVLFQDDICFPNGKGKELKAADFVFSLKRLVDPNNMVPYVGFIEGRIKGLEEWKKNFVVDYLEEVEGLKALDDYTLQITLTAPWPNFLDFLTMPPSFVVAKEAVMKYGPEFLNHPVGTGPFILEGVFDPQAKRLVCIKNPTFREKLFPTEADPQYQHVLAYAGKKLPLVDKVVTEIITEEQPRWLKMQKAELDIDRVDETAFVLSIVKDGTLLPEWVEKGLVLDKALGASTEFFAFNHNHALLSNVHLRQAMSMAFDRETYNKRFYNATAQVAQSLVPPVLMAKADPLVNSYSYNLERAKEYMAKAGYPGGKGLPVITFDTRGETTFKNKADFFAQCMSNIGINVQVTTNIWLELEHKISKGATMMHTITWMADYPDPSNFFQLLDNEQLAGLHYKNIELNKLLDQAIVTVNREERNQLYLTLNKMVAEAVPMIWTVHTPHQFLYHKWVKNFAYNGFDLSFDQYISVNMEEKRKSINK